MTSTAVDSQQLSSSPAHLFDTTKCVGCALFAFLSADHFSRVHPRLRELQNVLVSFVRRIVTLVVVVHRMGLGFNLFLGDQMAVLASDVVCVRLRLLRCPTPGLVAVLVCVRLRLLRCPTPGLVVCCGAVTAPSAPAV